MTEYRITEQRSFGPTLDFDSLPAIGAHAAHAGRGRVWQRLLVALGGFWIVALGVAFVAWAA